MTSPILSSSPMSISPVRRRSLSPSEISDANSIRPPRHSPTLTRSFDPNDPQVRERQRTMDVDMAMQLSLARRETLHSSPVATFTSPGGLSSSQQLQHSPQRDHEQYEEDGMNGDNDDGLHRTAREGDISPFNTHHYQHHHQDEDIDEADADLRNLTGGGGVGDGGSVPTHDIPPLRQDSLLPQQQHARHEPRDNTNANISNYGLPTYQANFSQSAFDFAPMEEWAVTEKTRLGINSPLNTRFLLNSVRGPSGARPSKLGSSEFTKPQPPPPSMNFETETPTAVSPNLISSDLVIPSSVPGASEGAVASGSSLVQQASVHNNIHSGSGEHIASQGDDPHSDRPLRHRKLSQSNPNPRSHRKGIGGKMALFESTNESPSFSARLGLVLGNHGSGIPPGSSYDHIAGVPQPGGPGRGVDGIVGGGVTGHGILNTGHDRPYRFSFYSNALSATIHARSLSELPAEGQTFEQLFSGVQPSPPHGAPRDPKTNGPEAPPILSPPYHENPYFPPAINANGRYSVPEKNTPPGGGGNPLTDDQDGNTWWLDVQNPTDEEMKMLSKVFNIHPLTTEDILMEETREKIELFRNYYLVCFRSFDQDPYSPTHLEPLNMYIIVFRQGTLSFHFRPTPHPQNVRRRIKQLKDYISVTSDWISYALIDDITDAFGPLIQGIEYEVDSIDELVLILKDVEQSDMLRRIGTCRKKVMGLLRLMGNKADVVKGLAKRCNENWRVAPTSDIGLYLSDIQDHLITMTQNLNHYEKILSRSHSNYLAQISIEMTDANNQINDVLSKLTALGTVLIPMNLVTGLWGMNVHVPGQDTPGYAWFISIIACLAAFALVGGYSTYRFMVRK